MKKYSLVLLMLIFSCSTRKHANTSIYKDSMFVPAKLYTAFYQQRAAEYKAQCIQSYNLAKMALDRALLTNRTNEPAIITDIDETILDNSPYAVKRALIGEEYTLLSWQEWTALGMADTLAGALSFFNYAKGKGVEVFYITNREEKERTGTLKNLQKYGFPDADNIHLLMKSGTSSKEARRQLISGNHRILLYIGDNLADLSAMFDKKTMEERSSNVFRGADQFGTNYILLPNPFYGDWEASAFNYKYDLKPAQKDSIIRSLLKSY